MKDIQAIAALAALGVGMHSDFGQVVHLTPAPQTWGGRRGGKRSRTPLNYSSGQPGDKLARMAREGRIGIRKA